MYVLRILVAHGLKGLQLYDVVRATTVARLLYDAPAWWGFAGQQDRCRLQSVISKLIRLRYLPEDYPKFQRLCLEADTRLFSAVLIYQGHVLHIYIVYFHQKTPTIYPATAIARPLCTSCR